MSNHLSPTSVSDHSSYTGNSGVSPSLSHRSIATTISSSSSPSPSAKMTSQDSDAGEFGRPKPITCRWDNCGRVYYDPEVVYKHLCDDHVGRKSTNNLCLTCRWEGCDVSCAKRDHITSHLRVHTPLKPHSCDICNKTFKRPQDLKKHERIHTDQHQQERQHKAAQNAAARTYSLSSESSAFGSYHLAAAAGAPTSYGYAGYPPHPAMYQHAGEAAYPSAYPALPAHQHMREHTPGYAQSNASLSPLSSRLDTPQGSSPAALASYPNTRDSYLNFTSGPDARQKATSDPNSYMFLAHGAGHASSGNLAGTKRNHEQVGEFFGDVRRKRIAPNYDAHMAERLNQTFGSTGIDDASLQALLSTFEAPSASAGMAQSHSQPSSTLHTPESNMSVSSQQPSRLALPDAMKPSDLAQLNAFLLQLGANAARDLPASTAPPTSTFGATSSTAALSDFDINSLNQYGLTSIPGFDESLFSGHQDTTQLGYQQAHMHRPIAQLPHRQHQPQSFGAATYSSNSLPHDMSGMAPHGSMYTHAPQQASFDSMRVSRGPAIVPQLAPMDMGGHSFRKVEALTRAAPGPTTTSVQLDRSSEVRTKESREDTMQDDDDDEMHGADLSREPSSSGSIFRDRYRSSSPTASSEGDASTTTEGVERYGSASPGLGLYPRLGSNDALRRLPSFRSSTSPSSSSSSPRRGLSISSMLSNEPGGSDSPSSSRRLPPIRQDSTSSEASSSMYPSLADQVSKIKGLGRPATVPDALRHRHVRLIRELLIAINFPEKAAAAVRSREGANDDERITLPPILTHTDKRVDYEEGERTPLSAPHGAGVAGSLPPLPPRTDSSNSSGEGSDGSGSSAATPPGRAKLPTISQLLNDVNVDVDVHRLPRGMDEREMECDV